MSEVIAEVGDIAPERIVAISGPNLAREIALRQPAASVVACVDEAVAERVADACAAPYFRPYTNTDVIGTELGGAVKNVVALAVGMAEGMGMGDNSKASIITRGLAETTRLGVALGGDPRDVRRPRGARRPRGHLYVPALAQPDLRRQPGRGMSVSEVVAVTRQTAEGVKSCDSVLQLAKDHGVDADHRAGRRRARGPHTPAGRRVAAARARARQRSTGPALHRAPDQAGRGRVKGARPGGMRRAGSGAAPGRGRARGPRRPRCRPRAAADPQAPWRARRGVGVGSTCDSTPRGSSSASRDGTPRPRARRPQPRPPPRSPRWPRNRGSGPARPWGGRPGVGELARRGGGALDSQVQGPQAAEGEQVSIGRDGAVRSRCCSSRSRSALPTSVGGVTRAPRITSEWPARYFVTECRTRSAPRARGCCTSGVAKVLSHTLSTPRSRAAAQGGHVEHLEHGVGRRLHPEHRRALEDVRDRPCVSGIEAAYPHGAVHLQPLEQRRRAVVGMCRHHHGPPVRDEGQGGRDGTHPGGEHQGLTALQRAEGLLEGRPRGVAGPGVVDRAVGDVGGGELERGVDTGPGQPVLPAQRDEAGGGGGGRRRGVRQSHAAQPRGGRARRVGPAGEWAIRSRAMSIQRPHPARPVSPSCSAAARRSTRSPARPPPA